MRPNLVLARVGASSLHPAWLADERTWDLRLVPYQEMPDQGDLDLTSSEVIPGPKWTGLREDLNTWDGWREYERIWLPDDDIATTSGAIDRMFEVAAGVGLDLFAPALDDESYFAHFVTRRNTSFF